MASIISNEDFIARLERVKVARKLSWAEAGKAVGISRAMVGFIRQGKHPVSQDVALSLAKAERDAGINPGARAIIEAIGARSRGKKISVTPKEIEVGVFEAELEYLTPKPPIGKPYRVTLHRPNVKVKARLVAAVLLEESYHPVLLACLPDELATDDFLNTLNPFCYNELAEAAMGLAFGQAWQEHLPADLKI